MFFMEETDKTFIWISSVLIVISVLIFLTLPNKGLFFYLFGAIILLIFAVTCILMAILAYSISGEGKEITFTGKNSLIESFLETGEDDRTLLLGLVVFLIVLLLSLNALVYYTPF